MSITMHTGKMDLGYNKEAAAHVYIIQVFVK